MISSLHLEADRLRFSHWCLLENVFKSQEIMFVDHICEFKSHRICDTLWQLIKDVS